MASEFAEHWDPKNRPDHQARTCDHAQNGPSHRSNDMEGHTSGNSATSSGETAGLTTKVLASRAAAAALSGPAVSPGQWVYRNYAVVATPDNAASPVTTERWATADNTTAAAHTGGQLEVGPWTWPVNPAATAGTSTRKARGVWPSSAWHSSPDPGYAHKASPNRANHDT